MAGDAAQLLNVQMEQIASMGMLITLDYALWLQIADMAQRLSSRRRRMRLTVAMLSRVWRAMSGPVQR